MARNRWVVVTLPLRGFVAKGRDLGGSKGVFLTFHGEYMGSYPLHPFVACSFLYFKSVSAGAKDAKEVKKGNVEVAPLDLLPQLGDFQCLSYFHH